MGVLPIWLRRQAVALRYGVLAVLCNLLVSLGGGVAAVAQEEAREGAREPVRIVALGDSLVHGYGLEQGDGFVPQLQDWLDGRDVAAEVVNAGVSGDTTAGGLSRFEWSVGQGADALIVVLGGNDLLRGIDPASSRENLDAILEKARDRDMAILLAGLTAPTNYGEDWKRAFDAMYPDLAEKHDTLHYPEFLAGVAEDRSKWQDDGIHPNADGVAEIVGRMGPMVVDLVERARAGAS